MGQERLMWNFNSLQNIRSDTVNYANAEPSSVPAELRTRRLGTLPDDTFYHHILTE